MKDQYEFWRDSLQEARDRIMRDRYSTAGTTCPCCEQNVKVFGRSVYDKNALSLIRLYKLTIAHPCNSSGYYHVSRIGDSDRSICKLAYWSLVEREPADPLSSKPCSGFWRITKNGKLFVINQLTIPKKAMVYNDHVLEYRGPQVSIIDALGERFNYTELMKGST